VVNATNVFSASVSTTTVAAGGELTITVTFTPTHSGEFSDELLLFTDAAATPQLTFPLSGFGLAPEIALSPESLSFGSLPVGCDSQRTVTISNTGTESLTISDLDLPEPFGFDAEISLPWTISAGGSREVGLTFAPEQVQGSSEVLTVTSSDPLNPTRILAVTGSGTTPGDQEDLFIQSQDMVLDTLFAVSTTTSMTDEIGAFVQAFSTYVETLEALGTDYRVAIVVEDGGEVVGSLDYIDSTTSVRSRAATMLSGQTGDDAEKSLQLLLDAADANKSWLRQSRLNLVGMSDAPDASDHGYSYYVSAYQDLRESAEDVRVHGIGGDSPGGCGVDIPAYAGVYDASVSTGGGFYSICTTDWNGLMESLALDSAPTSTSFHLTTTPRPETISVTVDGLSVEDWSYSEAEQAVSFQAPPEPGAEIVVSYDIQGECP
jgi:hypothetical protein